MKIIKINAIWCSACLVMNKIFDEIKKDTDVEIIELDYDMDTESVKQYKPGNILPVIIFLDDKDKEVKRLVGEVKKSKILETIEELGGNL